MSSFLRRLLPVVLLAMGLFPARAQLVRQANTTLNLPATLPAATGYTLENALGTLTFSAPVCLASIPNQTNALFVAERNLGLIQRVNLAVNPPTKSQWFALNSLLAPGETRVSDGENGFLSMAFHPNFASNGVFFVFYSFRNAESTATADSDDCFQRVHKVVVSNPGGSPAVLASHQPLITQFDQATNHNGGDMHFGPDGYLYVSVGDEGDGGDTFNNARFITKDFFGGLLRLDVDKRPGNLEPNPHRNALDNNRTQFSTSHPSAVHTNALGQAYYSVPADNPFIGLTSWHNLAISPSAIRTEFWATGLRNPWRFSFDPPTGRLFLNDVGQNCYEEVDLITRGGDYGWSWREGLHAYASTVAPTTPPASGFTPINPIFEYDDTVGAPACGSDSGNDAVITGNSTTGGLVMRGNRLPELYGKYIFADFGSHIIAALTENAGTWTGQRLLTANPSPLNSGQIVETGVDPRNNDVLFCCWQNSQVRRLARSGTSGTAPPALLSGTGAFADLATLTPNAGIVPYDINVPFWSDHAIKSRWFSIPSLSADMTHSRDGLWGFPTNQVWIKHFDFEMVRGNPASRRKLETRFLVRNATGAYGLVYKWRSNGLDADLVAEEGLNEVLSITVDGAPATQTWRYPSRSECMTCHTPQSGFALSMNTRQLNREATYGGVTTNLLRHLEQAGYFGNAVDDPGMLPAFARATDTTQSLDWRVRSYLAVNCVQCHQPGGAALGAWDARSHLPLDSAGLLNGSLANPGGDPDNRVIVPGDLVHSMLLRRLTADGMPRMPPLGSNVTDPGAIQLVTEWVTSLTNRVSYAQWQTVHFGSPAHPDADPGDDPDGDGLSNALEFLGGSLPGQNGDAWTWSATHENGRAEFAIPLPAGRGCLVETSTNLLSWTRWDVPGNTLRYSPGSGVYHLGAPLNDDRRFFRLQLSQP